MFSDIYLHKLFEALETGIHRLDFPTCVNPIARIEIHHVTWKLPEDRRCM